jgi:hypothetical protein
MPGVELDDLYGLPLDRFVPERASLVRQLRSAGEREQAAVVAALRKPSVAAWAVNQLVRTQRREVEALYAAGDALREVQAGVLGGSADARELRSAAEQERAAVDVLVALAQGLLSSGGQELTATTVERVAETLHAAALDDEARQEVSDGRLVRELRHVGLGGGLGGAVTAPPARPPSGRSGKAATPAKGAKGAQGAKPAKSGKVQRDEGKRARQAPAGAAAERQAQRERTAADAAERREREEARKQARAMERDAAREVDRAERALRAAQQRHERAAEALSQAEAAVQDAEAGLTAATAAHRQAKQRLDAA